MESKGLSVTTLKLIGMFTMFLDHFAVIVLTPLQMSLIEPSSIFWYQLFIVILRLIGRITFPIFAFLIVNGYKHTGHPFNYLLRLVVFAILSEPFFDYAVSGTLFEWSHQNIFFTLALGLMTIWGYDWICKQKSKILGILWMILMGMIATFLNFDYGFYGILTITSMYAFFDNFKKMRLTLIMINLYDALLVMGIAQVFSLFALGFIKKYNGSKGANINKYLFYVFYPLHLFLLALVR